jgi:hypothetical protein
VCLLWHRRKCRLHVGPRYKARGLNDNADPGNEIECDQVVWKHSSSPDRPLPWSRCGCVCAALPSAAAGGCAELPTRADCAATHMRLLMLSCGCRYTWRRGSVPLWWSVNIRNGGMGEAEIRIHTTNTFRGSRRCVCAPGLRQHMHGGHGSSAAEHGSTHVPALHS